MHPTATHNNKWAKLQNLIPRSHALLTSTATPHRWPLCSVAACALEKFKCGDFQASMETCLQSATVSNGAMVEESASPTHIETATYQRGGFESTLAKIIRRSAVYCEPPVATLTLLGAATRPSDIAKKVYARNFPIRLSFQPRNCWSGTVWTSVCREWPLPKPEFGSRTGLLGPREDFREVLTWFSVLWFSVSDWIFL